LAHENIGHYIKQINTFRPDFIHGYPTSLYFIARYIVEEGISLCFQPKMIAVSSETLFDYQREIIEKAFGAKVFVFYGNTEFCGNITECPYGKLHVQPYHSYVRVIDSEGAAAKPGEQGSIVATNFSNLSFALINYDLRDIVTVSADQNCSCNKGGMIVDSIEGRVDNYIITPEGRWVARLGHLFKDAHHVRCAQIEQEDPSFITIRIEREDSYSQAVEDAIIKEARTRLGNGIIIRFDYVDEIERLPNGKFPFIVQKMNLSWRSGDREPDGTHTIR